MIAPFHHDMPPLFPEQQSMSHKAKSNEWYTPGVYIEAARRVFGGVIDLDPASCELANRTVRARRYYTEQENGLMQEWKARNVWLNPPYGRTYKGTGTSAFVSKLLYEYGCGNVEQACILTMMGMYASWFFKLLQFPVCFLHEKPLFNMPDGTKTEHGFAACLTYLGPHEDRFIEEFSAFGTIAKRVSGPRKEIQPLSLWEGVPHA